MRKVAHVFARVVMLAWLASSPAIARDTDAVVREAASLIDSQTAGKRLVMLGEIHGTAEIPAIAGEVAARWTGGVHRQRVLLGLEATSTDQGRVDRYLASKGTAADRAALLTGNVHAMTGAPPQMYVDDKPFTPPTTVARHLVDLRPVSIEFRGMSGDAWTCQATCGRHALATPGRAIGRPTMERENAGASWDYLVALPRFSASEPAVTARAASPGSN